MVQKMIWRMNSSIFSGQIIVSNEMDRDPCPHETNMYDEQLLHGFPHFLSKRKTINAWL